MSINPGAPNALRFAPRQPERWGQQILPSAVAVRPKNTEALVELRASAAALGQVCFSLHKMRKQLGTAIARRMMQRKGGFIYQSVAFSIDNFPLQAAEEIFPSRLVIHTDNSCTTWSAGSQTEVLEMVGSLLCESQYACVDAARALKTESQRVVRVISQILPGAEISWVSDSDMERLYVNFHYVLAEENGEVYPPKDKNRREMLIESENMTALRQALMSAIMKSTRRAIRWHRASCARWEGWTRQWRWRRC